MEQEAAREHAEEFGVHLINMFLPLALLVAGLYVFWDSLPWWGLLISAFFSLAFLGTVICPIFTLLLIAIALLLGLAVDTLILEPAAWIMTCPTVDRWVKFFSVFLLLIGFHFDLLSS